MLFIYFLLFFFFNDTATTEIYTLSLHDALPILSEEEMVAGLSSVHPDDQLWVRPKWREAATAAREWDAEFRVVRPTRSEEHTSELQSRQYLVCRLLLEKKKNITYSTNIIIRKSF